MNKPWHQHFETIGSISAIVVGVIALIVAWDQGRVMRAQQHGAVYPVLQIEGFVSNSPDQSSIGLVIRNSGVGPALIESVELFREGEPIDGFNEFRARLPQGYNLSWAGLTGRALAPGEEITPVSIFWQRSDITPEQLQSVTRDWDHYGLRICYCSVFDRCWATEDVGGSRAEQVRRCEASEQDIFEELGALEPGLQEGRQS